MGDKPPEKGGRYGLPGIPSYIDRVSQETIYADKIISEEKYLEYCKGVKIGDHMEKLGVLKGFEIIKFPSYVEVKKIYDPEEAREKGAFRIGHGTAYARDANSPPPPRPLKRSVAERIQEAKAECNKTAPTYAYKYFSEKHMAQIRGGPRAPRKVKSLAELKAEHPHAKKEEEKKQLKTVQSEPKFKQASRNSSKA